MRRLPLSKLDYYYYSIIRRYDEYFYDSML
jgi:hypothetical protein